MEFIGNSHYIPFTFPLAQLGDLFSCIKWWSRFVWGVTIGLWILNLLRTEQCRIIAGRYAETTIMTIVEVCVDGPTPRQPPMME